MTRDDVDAVMAELFPASAPGASLEYVACSERAPDAVDVTLRLVLWSTTTNAAGDETRSITDVKEQDLDLGAVGALDVVRFRAFVAAWVTTLARAFVAYESRLDTLMPHDIACFDVLALQRANTQEDFERALSANARLGRFLRDASEQLALDDVDLLLRAVFPADGGRASFEYIECEKAGPFVRVTLRFITYDRVAGVDERVVRDIKEQQCVFAPLATSPARFEADVRAWVDVVTRAFAGPPKLDRDGDDVIDTLMPHDFVKHDVLALQTAVTQDDFARAFLQRTRLGHLFPASAHDDDDDAPPDEPPPRDESL